MIRISSFNKNKSLKHDFGNNSIKTKTNSHKKIKIVLNTLIYIFQKVTTAN